MRSHHHHVTLPGRVDGFGLLYGGMGLVLAVAMQWLGLFRRGDARLENWLLEPVFHGEMPGVLPVPVLVLVTAVFCFGLAYAVLDSPGMWRRCILGITALTVLIAMLPTLAVWKIYFSPFFPIVGVFWTWLCTMMYVNHHVMPCDTPGFKTESRSSVAMPPKPKNTRLVVVKQPVAEEADRDEKYKPREKSDG